MPAAGQIALSKDEVMMYLTLANLNRTAAAKLAGVSRDTLFRAMRHHRVKVPKPQAKLNTQKVEGVKALLGKLSRREIDDAFGVHVRTIDQIAMHETWYWVRRIEF